MPNRLAVERGALLQQVPVIVDAVPDLQGGGHVGPGIADGLLEQRGLLLHGLAELLLLGVLAAQDRGVLQAGQHAQPGLAAVLDAEQVILRPAGVLPASRAVGGQA